MLSMQHSISAFRPCNPSFYQQIDASHSRDIKCPLKSPSPSSNFAAGRRYRQNELNQSIASLALELETLRYRLTYAGIADAECIQRKIKQLNASIYQKQKHLKRLQKNVKTQQTLRIKKGFSSTEGSM